MADPTIRTLTVAVLLKLETFEGVDAVPDPTVDAIPVEADSITTNNPWTTENANESTGTLVAGSPLIIGQAATFSFKSRIKGAGNNVTYTATVKPPLHPAFQCCGWRGQFAGGLAAAAAVSGTADTLTLPVSFPNIARASFGLPLTISAGVGIGAAPNVIEYTAARVATLSETFNPPLDATTTVALTACWTYASTSPDASSRAVDQPSATCYIYIDGTLRKFVGCRGTLGLDGKTARPGYGTFSMTGIYAGKVDAAIPTNLVIAGHIAPVLVQGTAKSPAVSMNKKPLTISTWSLDAGSTLEVPDDPNTPYGFGAGQITDRMPMLKVDPLATLVANRDTVTDMGNGATMPAVLRHGSQMGNRWSLVVAKAQPVGVDNGARGKLMSEDVSLQCLTIGRDSFGRDTDRILVFS